MRLRPVVTACLLAGTALLLYAFHVSVAPLTPQEAAFNTHGQSIRGGWTPLFFRVDDGQWLQPIGVYANAAVHAIGGDEISGRVASIVAAAINVGLVFLIAHLASGRILVGALAAAMLMFTPAHWSIAQLGTDAILPVPLVLLWLWSSLRFLKLDKGLAVAAGALGLSVYSHPAAPLTAAFLWALTLVVAHRRNRVRLLTSTAIFVVAWLPAAAWFYRHPDSYADTFGRWFVFAAHLRSPLEGLSAFMNLNTLGTRASLYWGFWDPSWLFFGAADANAPLLAAVAPFIAIGLYRCAKHLPREWAQMVIGALVIAPVAGATFSVPRYMTSAASVLPILSLIAALGVDQLIALATRRRSLEESESGSAGDGWDSDQLAPRS
jgi:hypothetical protein